MEWLGRGATQRLGWLLVGLFVVSFMARALFLTVVWGVDAPMIGDEGDYHRVAEEFLDGEGWSVREQLSYRPPVISVQLSVAYLLTGSTDSGVARWTMVFFSSMVAPMLFLVTWRLLRRRSLAALLAAGAWTLYPPAIWYASRIMTETTAALLLLAALGAFLWTTSTNRRVLPATLTGSLWALSALNRPILLLIPMALLGGQLLLSRFGPIDWGLSRIQWMISLAAFVVVMSPWTVRNFVEHGVFMPGTSGSGYVLLISNGTLDHPTVRNGGYYKHPDLMAMRNQVQGEAERDAFSRNLALEQIRENWRFLPEVLFSRVINFWTTRPDPFDPSWTRNDWIMLFIWGPTLALFLASSFIRRWRHSWPVLTTILYVFVFGLPFWSIARFRFSVDSLIVIGAVVGLMELVHRIGGVWQPKPLWLNSIIASMDTNERTREERRPSPR
jgi:hypothetical protein